MLVDPISCDEDGGYGAAGYDSDVEIIEVRKRPAKVQEPIVVEDWVPETDFERRQRLKCELAWGIKREREASHCSAADGEEPDAKKPCPFPQKLLHDPEPPYTSDSWKPSSNSIIGYLKDRELGLAPRCPPPASVSLAFKPIAELGPGSGRPHELVLLGESSHRALVAGYGADGESAVPSLQMIIFDEDAHRGTIQRISAHVDPDHMYTGDNPDSFRLSASVLDVKRLRGPAKYGKEREEYYITAGWDGKIVIFDSAGGVHMVYSITKPDSETAKAVFGLRTAVKEDAGSGDHWVVGCSDGWVLCWPREFCFARYRLSKTHSSIVLGVPVNSPGKHNSIDWNVHTLDPFLFSKNRRPKGERREVQDISWLGDLLVIGLYARQPPKTARAAAKKLGLIAFASSKSTKEAPKAIELPYPVSCVAVRKDGLLAIGGFKRLPSMAEVWGYRYKAEALSGCGTGSRVGRRV